MSAVVGFSLASSCAAFVLGLLIAKALRRDEPKEIAEPAPPPAWTCTWEAMKETDELGRLIGDAVFDRIAKTTGLTNKHGTPHIDENEVEALCDVVLDHANAVINQWKSRNDV